MAKMTNTEFVRRLIDVCDNYKTVYGMGMPGMPITDATIKEKVKQSSWWKPVIEIEIRKLIGKGYFGFDCICLAKAILWGWSGDFSKRLGGAKYVSNGVLDWGADYTNRMGLERSTDFSKIELGHYVWMTGHIGFYIGNGLVIEASPKWKNGVQKTAVLNIGKKSGYNGRKWTTHGKLPWVDYITKESDKSMTLYKGLKGDRVKQLQLDLIELGYDFTPYGADGSFGGVTDNVVRLFQRDNGLEVDGRVGGKTRAKLAELLQDNLNQEDEDLEKLQLELDKANAIIAAVKKALGV